MILFVAVATSDRTRPTGSFQHFSRLVAKISQFNFVNSEVTGPKFSKFLHEIIATVNAVAYVIFRFLPLNSSVTIATSQSNRKINIKKIIHSHIFTNAENLVKIGPVGYVNFRRFVPSENTLGLMSYSSVLLGRSSPNLCRKIGYHGKVH